MVIDTVKGDETVQKEVFTGGGVVIAVPGTRFRVTGEVLEIAPDDQTLHVKGADFDGWIGKMQVKDVLSPGVYAIDNAINVIGETE